MNDVLYFMKWTVAIARIVLVLAIPSIGADRPSGVVRLSNGDQHSFVDWKLEEDHCSILDDSSWKSLPLSAVNAIHLRSTRLFEPIPQGTVWLMMTNGDRIVCQQFTQTEDRAEFRTPWSTSLLAVSTSRIVAVLAHVPLPEAPRQRLEVLLQRSSRNSDSIVLRSGEQKNGEFLSWRDSMIEMGFLVGKGTIRGADISAVIMNASLVDQTPQAKSKSEILTIDGCRLSATKWVQIDRSIQLELPYGDFSLPLDQISRLTPMGPDVIPLADVSREGISFKPAMLPVRIGDREVTRPFVQPPGTVGARWNLEPQQAYFQAEVGFPDRSDFEGTYRVAIRVDERVVWEHPRLEPRDYAVAIPIIKLDQAKTLELVVNSECENCSTGVPVVWLFPRLLRAKAQ